MSPGLSPSEGKSVYDTRGGQTWPLISVWDLCETSPDSPSLLRCMNVWRPPLVIATVCLSLCFCPFYFPVLTWPVAFSGVREKKKTKQNGLSVYDLCLLVGDLNSFGSARSSRNLNYLCLSHSKSVLLLCCWTPTHGWSQSQSLWGSGEELGLLCGWGCMWLTS